MPPILYRRRKARLPLWSRACNWAEYEPLIVATHYETFDV